MVFWILLFDVQRLLFSIHHWGKLEGVSFGEWLLTFIYSLRLDLATAAYLSLLPLLLLSLSTVIKRVWIDRSFYAVLLIESVLVALIHSGEINVYSEWNHKLTSRVFMHLSNPDEVFRTAI